MWIVVSGDNQYVSNLVFSLYMSDSLAKVELVRNVMAHAQKTELVFL